MNTPKANRKSLIMGFVFTLLLASFFFSIKAINFNLAEIVILVACLVYGGYKGGIASAIALVSADLFYYTDGLRFWHLSLHARQDLLALILSATIIVLMVGHLYRKQEKAMKALETFNDILKQRNNSLKEKSEYDELTGVKNRAAFRTDFTGMMEGMQAVIFFDIDDFKKFNDSYGHDMGDFVVTSVAAELVRVFGRKHCYRYGGDEFIAVMPFHTEIEIQKSINKMQADLLQTTKDGKAIPISITAGYCFGFISSTKDLRGIMHQADLNLYYSKARKKGSGFGSEYYSEDFYTNHECACGQENITI